MRRPTTSRRANRTRGVAVAKRRPGTPRGAGRERGFTLIEVMMALAVMTVGAMGIMALQQATTRGTGQAREMTTATQATRTWVERINRDSLRWNSQGPGGLSTADGPVYLAPPDAPVPLPGAGATGWYTPVDPDAEDSYAFDYTGQDTFTASEARYCTQLNWEWLDAGNSIRVDVRTVWIRRGDGTLNDRFGDCQDAAGAITAAVGSSDDNNRVRAVRASTVIRWHLLPSP